MQAAHRAGDGRGFKTRLRCGDVEGVGFVVAEAIGTVGLRAALDHEARRAVRRDRDAGFGGELSEEAAGGAVEAARRRGRELDAEVAVQAEGRARGLDFFGHGISGKAAAANDDEAPSTNRTER